MSLVSFIMYLLTAFLPSDALDFDYVYSVLNDTELSQIYVDDSSLASGISTYAVNDIDDVVTELVQMNQVLGSVSSTNSGTINGRLYRISDYLSGIYSEAQDLANGFGYWSPNSTFQDDFEELLSSFGFSPTTSLRSVLGYSGLNTVAADLGAIRSGVAGMGSGLATEETLSDFLTYFSTGLNFRIRPQNDSLLTSAVTLRDFLFQLQANMIGVTSGGSFLTTSGSILESSVNRTFSNLFANGFVGLARLLMPYSGSNPSASYTLTTQSDGQLVTTSGTASSLGRLIAALGTQLQSDTAALRYVLANEEDIELREDASENTNAAADDFVKPGGAGTPTVGQIGDAGSISSDVTGELNTGVSSSEGLQYAFGADGWGFFSQTTQNNLNPGSVYDSTSIQTFSAEDDDFIDFFDPDALEKFLGRDLE